MAAIDDRATRQELRRYRRVAWFWTVAGFVVLSGALAILPADASSSNLRGPAEVAVGLGGAAFGLGLGSLGRARQLRLVLESNEWRRVGCRYGQLRNASSTRLLMLSTPDSATVAIMAISALVRRTKSSGVSQVDEVDVSGDQGRRMVARVPGSPTLLLLLPPKTPKIAREWADFFADSQ